MLYRAVEIDTLSFRNPLRCPFCPTSRLSVATLRVASTFFLNTTTQRRVAIPGLSFRTRRPAALSQFLPLWLNHPLLVLAPTTSTGSELSTELPSVTGLSTTAEPPLVATIQKGSPLQPIVTVTEPTVGFISKSCRRAAWLSTNPPLPHRTYRYRVAAPETADRPLSPPPNHLLLPFPNRCCRHRFRTYRDRCRYCCR